MDVKNEQKQLKVFSTVALVFGLIALALGALALFGSGMILGNTETITTEAGVSTDELVEFSGAVIVGGLSLLLAGVTNMVNSAFLKKVAKDAKKYKPAWIITLVSLVLSVVSVFSQFSNGADIKSILTSAGSLALNGYIFYLVNKVKQSVAA